MGTHEQALRDTRKQMVSHKVFFRRFDCAFDKQKQKYKKTSQSLDEKRRQKRIDDQHLARRNMTSSSIYVNRLIS